MQELISVSKLSKKFGEFAAVDGISLNVNKGEVLGFLGPNGAGKTTTMRMVTGYLQPTSGEVKICGIDILQNPIEAKRKIGYLPEGGPLYNDMTPESFLTFIGQVRGLKGFELKQRLNFVVEKLHLQGVYHKTIDNLSKGYKRRVALAQAIIHDPEVLVLDEPTDGLDPNQKHEVRELINSMAKDKAIIISTHILEEVEALCPRVVIIAKGSVVASGTPEELRARTHGHNAVVVKLRRDSADKILSEILKIKNVDKVKMEGNNAIIAFPKKGRDILGDISSVMFQQKLQIEEIYVKQGALDEAFREMTV